MRLAQAEVDDGVEFRLRPFYLGMIFQAIGRRPFVEEPQKSAYMWRGIERRAERLGLSPKLPAPYPAKNPFLAAQLAYYALDNGFGRPFIEATYREWFEHGVLVGEEANIAASLRSLGKDPQKIVEAASAEAIDDRLREETKIAQDLGIFGSPTFAVGKELFWGDDRLEDAVSWAHGAK